MLRKGFAHQFEHLRPEVALLFETADPVLQRRDLALSAFKLLLPSAGSTSGTLVLTGTVSDGATLQVTSELLTQILEGTNGIVDFYRTAYLSVTFLDGAVGNPSDPRFLSIEPDRGQPSVIPLPASGLLLLGAFGGLALMRLRRRPRG